MRKSQRIEPVVQIAAGRAENAARQLGDCRRLLEEREARLEELRAYHREYARRFEELASTAAAPARICDFRVFLARLATAIQQQGELVAATRRECEARRQAWTDASSRAKALDSVAAAYRREELHDEDCREQWESDEFAQRIHASRSGE